MNQDKRKIRARVLRGIALNRIPGLHFAGNFLDASFDRVSRAGSRMSFVPGPWCVQEGGEIDFASFALLTDFALAACVRSHVDRAARMGTITLGLQFTGRPRVGRLSAKGSFEGFFEGSPGRLGLSRVSVTGAAGLVCHGTGSFMALEPPPEVKLHPVPLRSHRSPEPRPLAERELHPAEREILRHADAAIAAAAAAGEPFVRHFWGLHPHRTEGGAACVFANGPHVGNRVGHVQGGILLALAAETAAAALPPNWRMTGINASYIRPGDGAKLHVRSRIVHQGRQTAVMRTEVFGRNRRRVLEVTSTHCAAQRD